MHEALRTQISDCSCLNTTDDGTRSCRGRTGVDSARWCARRPWLAILPAWAWLVASAKSRTSASNDARGCYAVTSVTVYVSGVLTRSVCVWLVASGRNAMWPGGDLNINAMWSWDGSVASCHYRSATDTNADDGRRTLRTLRRSLPRCMGMGMGMGRADRPCLKLSLD